MKNYSDIRTKLETTISTIRLFSILICMKICKNVFRSINTIKHVYIFYLQRYYEFLLPLLLKLLPSSNNFIISENFNHCTIDYICR